MRRFLPLLCVLFLAPAARAEEATVAPAVREPAAPAPEGKVEEAAPTGAGLTIETGAGKDQTPQFVVRAANLPNEAIIAVSQIAKDAGQAEKEARAMARREGLRFILQAQAPEKAAALMQMLETVHQDALVRRMTATDEVRTIATYKATLRIVYDAAGLEGVLGQPLKDLTPAPPRKIPGRTPGQAALVIPLWTKDGKTQIWDMETPWRKAVARAALEESKGRLVMPYGDEADQRAVTADNALTLTPPIVAPLLSRYGTSEVLVASASPMPGNVLRLQLLRLGESGTPDKQEMLITPEAGATPENVMRKAASELATLARKQYQTGSQSAADASTKSHTIHALSPVTRAADWANMRGRLRALSMVNAVEATHIGTDRVEMDITFHGPADRFGAALKTANIHATPQADKLLLGFYPLSE